MGANAVTVGELAVRISAEGVQATQQGLQTVERSGRAAETGLASAAAGATKLSSITQSLTYSFNGLAASTIGIPQSFGTLFSTLAPLAVGGVWTAGILAGITILGRAWEVFGGKAKQAAKDAAEAAQKVRDELDKMQDAGDAKGLRSRARTLYQGTASKGFDDGVTGLSRQIAEQQDRYDAAVRQGNIFEFNAAKGKLADLKAKLAPVQSEFDDIRRRILAPGPAIDYEPTAVSVTAKSSGRAARDAAAAARKAAAAALEAERRKARQSRAVDAPFGSLSNITGSAGLDLTNLIGSALESTREADNQQRRINFDGKIAPVKQDLSRALSFLGDPDELARLAHLTELRDTLAGGVGDAVAGGLTAGFAAAFAGGDPFGALAGAMLGGLGDAVERFGQGVVATAPLMLTITHALRSLNPAVALPAGVALIALGAGIKAVAGRAFGGSSRGGGYGGGYSGGFGGGGYAPPEIIDRGVIAGAYGAPTIPTAQQTSGKALGSAPTPVTVHATIIGADDPGAQRGVVELIRNAVGRGYTAPGFAPAAA